MFTNNLKQARQEAGLSQLELARRTRISPAAICNLEHGKQFPYDGWTDRIAEALNKPKSDIFPAVSAKTS